MVQLRTSLKPPIHNDTVVSSGLRGALIGSVLLQETQSYQIAEENKGLIVWIYGYKVCYNHKFNKRIQAVVGKFVVVVN